MSQIMLLVNGEFDGDLVLTLSEDFRTRAQIDAKFDEYTLVAIVNSWVAMKKTQVRSGRKLRESAKEVRAFALAHGFKANGSK